MSHIARGGAVYTSGVWVVKEGREDEFERRWQEGADGLALEFPDVKFMLLRDRDNPRRFVSLGEGWRNAQQIEEARSLPGFQDAMAATWRVLETGELSTYDLVAEVS
jgi:quinol monooxygenase YgiN